MRKIVKKTTLYQCPICKTKYKKASDAKACEDMPVEELTFKVGDKVEAFEPRHCENGPFFTFHGTIIKVSKPMPPDEEYETKWLGGKKERLYSHVHEYKAKGICPHCGKIVTHIFFAPELKNMK